VDFAKCCSKAGRGSEKEGRNLSDTARKKLEILEAVGRATCAVRNGGKKVVVSELRAKWRKWGTGQRRPRRAARSQEEIQSIRQERAHERDQLDRLDACFKGADDSLDERFRFLGHVSGFAVLEGN
jgi:hypothetical protein